jgi:poly(A) polymerase
VVFGRGREHETIEVSTFRAYLDAAAADAPPANVKDLAKPDRSGKGDSADKKHVVDASGRVLRDNVWGPQVEDAARRDFTINAMYYDPTTQIVVDYHGGLADSRARLLRMIGDPPTRYREDPVRIIRVVRFAAKLGFALEPATFKPIAKAAPLLANVPISRLFDEMVKLMQTGHAIASIEQMRKFGLIGGKLGIFPVLDAALAPATPNPAREKFVRLALEDTDRRVNEGRAVAPSFMLACMLWHDVQERWSALKAGGEAPFPALQLAVDAVFDARIGDISGRGKLAADMREIWLMQPRFERRTVSSATALLAQARFRAGYDFLRLRADCGDVAVDLADWWEDLHLGNDEEREALLMDLRPQPGAKGKRAAAPTARAGAEPVAEASDESQGDDDEADEGGDGAHGPTGEVEASAPRKRRRRRRKPAGSGGGGGGGGAGGEGPAPAA